MYSCSCQVARRPHLGHNFGMAPAVDRSFDIRLMTERDYPQVREILQAGMDTGEATFESEAPDWLGFSHHRIMDLAFVAVEGDKVLGWITATPASHREVFVA